MIIDQFNADPKNDKKGEFKYSMQLDSNPEPLSS